MSGGDTYLSVIVPIYNAGSFIAQTLVYLDDFLSILTYSRELIIVDDGSVDGSKDIAAKWAMQKRNYAVRFLAHDKNRGKGAAVANGMLASTGKYRIFLDADLAYPPSQILRVLEELERGNDLAIACRVHPETRCTLSPAFFHYLYTRHIASRVINWLMRRTIIPHSRDSQAGLKGFRADIAREIFSRQIVHGFPFDVEALYLAEKMGCSIREVAVEYRYFNEPTTVVFLQDGLRMAKDVFRVRFNHLLKRYKLPEKGGPKKLVINADDYAMTLPISRGILKACSAGAVLSTSAMANSPDFDAAMDEIVSMHAHPDIGFHATLTWGRPVLDPKEVPTLVDKDGKFLPKAQLFKRALLRKISADEVYRELYAQCEKLAKRWPELSHMDGHHHVHTFPVVRKAAERVAREFGIRFVRSPHESRWSTWYRAFIKRLTVKSLSASHPAYWRGRGFLSTDHFGGFSLRAGDNLKQRWIETLSKLPFGTSEIMVHPGFESENGDSYNAEREAEVEVLKDAGLIDVATKAGVKFISFRDLQKNRL